MSTTPDTLEPSTSPPSHTVAGPAVTTTAVTRRGPSPITAVLLLPFLPLAAVGKRLVFRVAEKQGNQVACFTSFSSLVYIWPIVLIGFLGYGLINVMQPAVLGWIWVFTVLFTLFVLGTDINRNAALVWALVIGLILAVGALVNAWYSIPLLGKIYDYFASLGVTFPTGVAMALAVLLSIVLVVVMVQAMFDGHHEISSREVTHRRFLRTSESVPLGINRVRLDWPDLLEMFVLFGAGHLVIIDQDRKEVMRIPNIPFLWFFRDEVNSILDVMATTSVDPAMATQVSHG